MKATKILTVAGLSVMLASPAIAADPEVARLREEVRELRQLVNQLMRVEKDHYDLLMSLVQQQGGRTAAPAPSGPAPATSPAPAAAAIEAKPPEEPHAGPRTASLRGTVQFPGGSLQDVYVYVENVRSPPVKNKTVEIAQRKKQFIPEVTVVQRGTRVVFPNYDTFVHNVFSPTSPRPFDIGSLRAGEESKAVEMTAPGVIDVFCNMHSDMHASVLVVPSPLYARVGSDGSFRLDGVPLGPRKLVVWSPRSKPAAQTVDVAAAGADVSLTLSAQPAGAHSRKDGSAYPSYADDKK